MGGESAGGGLVVALAAVLWLVYLMPSWLRRRQYLATERNAVRLQQTLRILAETAEVPAEVRAEVHARSVRRRRRRRRSHVPVRPLPPVRWPAARGRPESRSRRPRPCRLSRPAA